MTAPRHVMILASAGSGKTYALTGRFIGLLALGVRPERIAALTFTRKAAGEFFDEILKKLAGAAADPGAASQLATEIARPALKAGDFRRMLREMIEAMPRLRLGTLDGFMAGVARNFALELGLAGDFELLENYGIELVRRRVLERMLVRTRELGDQQKDFVEAFKRATFGREAKRLSALLEEFIEKHQQVYLDVAAPEKWGRREAVWPEGSVWLEAEKKPEEIVRKLRAELAGLPMEDVQRGRMNHCVEQVQGWRPGAPLGEDLEFVLKKVLADWPAIEAGAAELIIERKKLALTPEAGAALADMARHVVGGELRRRLEVTRGLHAMMASYEAFYDPMVRRAGRLTFADVQRLLAPEAGTPMLTSGEGGIGRLGIDYRLDGKIDHWLLDEFQDTSRGQWNILKNLVDEAVQDEAGERSFFCVGDVKQAIYGWRSGEPRLFREILGHYNAAGETIRLQHLTESWRSGPAVIALVNAVFGQAAIWSRLFPGEMAERWNREWQPHTTRLAQRNGQAAWLLAEDRENCREQMLAVLREIRPWERGLSAVVLVRNNATAAELADYLRQNGAVPAVAEADLQVCADNPIGAALLALVQAAAHPDDTLAQEHWRMTPLGAVVGAEEGLETPEGLSRRVLGQINDGGFAGVMEHWAGRLTEAGLVKDEFSRLRLRQLLAAAREFDETGSRDTTEFAAFMQRYSVRDREGTGVVRVMTIHKSKGLGFDVVIMPDLEGSRLDQAREEPLAVKRSSDGQAEWVFEMPVSMMVDADPTLRAYKSALEAENGYEAINLFYVAMTRAKRALYLVTAPMGKSTSHNYPRILTETLGNAAQEGRVGGARFSVGWTAGDADWHLALGKAAPNERDVRELPEPISPAGRRPRRLELRRPSREGVRGHEVAGIFTRQGSVAGAYGRAVHALLAQVEWADGAMPGGWEQATGSVAAREEAKACLLAPGLAEVWRRPAGAAGVELWREKGFEVVIDNAWVTGIFDRVVVERDGSGRVRRVVVYDYKTDGIEEDRLVEAVARHGPQIDLYRRAAALLVGVNTETVGSELIFTRMKRCVPVPLRLA